MRPTLKLEVILGDYRSYTRRFDDEEAAARRAIERGLTAEQAGDAYRLPAGREDRTLFSPQYFARAVGSWMTALNGV